MRKVVVTGLGFISSIGNDSEVVVDNLKALRHGFEPFIDGMEDAALPKWYGSIKGFNTTGNDSEAWTYPDKYRFSRLQLKTMSPHVMYAHCALLNALEDAGLSAAEISHPRTGLYSASAGSPVQQYEQLRIMNTRGVMRCSPFGIVTATVGTINFNLGASFKIKGSVCGMASACASSAHALGFAYDEIAMGRQDRMIVIGAEDGNREAILPFAAMRALSCKEDPREASCPFDANRSGFVGTGGAVAIILESEEVATERSASIYAEFKGWGQGADGHSAAMSHPEGDGLSRSIENALVATEHKASDVDYVNAHGTSTPVGDMSEIRALKSIWGGQNDCPAISSTKALTGHGLSQAGALEAGICCLAIREGFMPASAHIQTLDPEAEGLNIIQETSFQAPKLVLSNSSGFGGANVTLVFKKWGD